MICRANNGLRHDKVNRNLDDELCNLSRVLTIIKCEINARENCTIAIEQERLRKNVSSSVEPLSAASLFSGQKSKLLCVFCKKLDWSDKCRTINDPISRKQFLKQGGYCFLCLKEEHKIRDCKKEKVCFYCKDYTIPLFVLKEKKRIRIKGIPLVERLKLSNVPRAKPINTSSVITSSCSNS